MKNGNETPYALFCESVECFRAGRDREGLRLFLDGTGGLKRLLDSGCALPGETLSELESAGQRLLSCVENTDVAGLTDLLEFSLCPALREPSEGDDAHVPGQ